MPVIIEFDSKKHNICYSNIKSMESQFYWFKFKKKNKQKIISTFVRNKIFLKTETKSIIVDERTKITKRWISLIWICRCAFLKLCAHVSYIIHRITSCLYVDKFARAANFYDYYYYSGMRTFLCKKLVMSNTFMSFRLVYVKW